MRALASRPQRIALGIAVLTAAALGTVSASAAQATGTTTATTTTTTTASAHAKPHKAVGLAVAYHPTANAPDDVNAANDDFAACMKDRGQSVFPDFHASKDDEGRVRLDVTVKGGGFDPTSKAYEKAVKVCGPILEKAGITFPDPADLPPLPTKPGQGPGSGTTRHVEPGTPAEPGLTLNT
ncbi:hypothetical protein ACYF6T_24365 [Streptomyces sp. 7R007]